jgi:hypothetical protein
VPILNKWLSSAETPYLITETSASVLDITNLKGQMMHLRFNVQTIKIFFSFFFNPFLQTYAFMAWANSVDPDPHLCHLIGIYTVWFFIY